MRDLKKDPDSKMQKQSNVPDEIENIVIKGAREHNLRNVSIEIPRNKLVVITGLSGSGKSSLAFDTLYAEGQRRYVECLSAYARQFLGMLKKPDVDVIEGLSPAISIEQKSITHNPRSTVGTVTEIYDYLRLLYAKVGVQYCVHCHIPVQQRTTDQIVEEILTKFKGMKIQILSPLVKGRKGHYRELFEQLQKQGFTKVRVDGQIKDIVDEMELSRYKLHDIELVVDRCISDEKQEQRIRESLELALHRSDGSALLLADDGAEQIETLYSSSYSCPECGASYETPSPTMFSFNSPYGACPECEGLGEIRDFDLDLVIPDASLTISEGAIAPIGKDRDMWLWNQINSFCEEYEINTEIPINELDESKLKALLYGDSKKSSISVRHKLSSSKFVVYKHKFIGVLPSLAHQYKNTSSIVIRAQIEAFMSSKICSACGGGRLKPSSLAILIDDKSIREHVIVNISKLRDYFSTLYDKLTEREQKIAGVIIKEISSRLKFLEDVGLSYLTMNRAIKTLSGGESQRIRLASQIGSELAGIMYVLDEPSIGLHQHDNDRLIESLKKLRDIGNSVVVVEHDKAMIEEADYVIDIGPRAGVNGGNILLNSAPKDFDKLSKKTIKESLTAQYILGEKKIEIPEQRREGNGNNIVLKGATGNNLKNVELQLPLGKFICVTGKSGSGKSTLINDTLYPIVSKKFYSSAQQPLAYESIEGLEFLDKVIEIDQTPIGRTPRSNPATYTGVFTQIRDFFAMLPESKIRGYKTGRFSFNIAGGRCETCEGGGIKKIEMNFLPDVYVTCDDCNGKRYNDETLGVKFKGKSIADVLDMTVEEACEFFSEIPKIKRKIDALNEVGLGYIKLGQQAPTLSGGEAQRVKLATELSKTNTGKTLYLLDEPTTGLHFEDIRILLKLIGKLVDKGSTAVVIEHNLDVIKCADWIIDLGPDGGEGGGRIVAQGKPEDIINSDDSLTAKYLKAELNL
jgi:excinuclease ABC subunit A